MAANIHVGAAAPGPATPTRNDNAPGQGCVAKGQREAVSGDCAGHGAADQDVIGIDSIHPEKVIALLQIRDQHAGNDAATQERRIFDALQSWPVSTLEARRYLDVLHPAARVLSLRQEGIEILTVWTNQVTECGKPHRVAKYVLTKGAAAAGGGRAL